MKLNAEMTSSMMNTIKLTIEDNGMVINRTISFEDFRKCINEYSSDSDFINVGVLPKNLVKASFASDESVSGNYSIFIPAEKRPMEYLGENFIISFPSLVFSFQLHNGKLQLSSVFAVKEKNIESVNDNTKLYNYPYGNVSPFSGRICWGSNHISTLKNLKDIDKLILLFFSSSTNNDLYSSFDSVTKNLSLNDLIKTMSMKDTFDNKFLRNTTKTLKDIFL